MNLTEPTLAPPMAPSTVDMAQIFAAHAERAARMLKSSRPTRVPFTECEKVPSSRIVTCASSANSGTVARRAIHRSHRVCVTQGI